MAEERVAKNVATMYEGFKQAISDKVIDYRDVAQMIVDIEKKTPRAKGGLKVMTEPDPAWRTFVDEMKAGNEIDLTRPKTGGYGTTVRNANEAAPLLWMPVGP